MGVHVSVLANNRNTERQSGRGWGAGWGSILLWTAILIGAWNFQTAAAASDTQPDPSAPAMLRLSLDDAMALFLERNFEVIVAKYGIESSKARQITASLFPNPEVSVGVFSSVTQICNPSLCGGVFPQVSQLFLIAGKRGFRIESAALETAVVEAVFEDTIRQLSFTVKDVYFRVQTAQEHLAVDQRIRDRLRKIVAGTSPDIRPVVSERKRTRLALLGFKAEKEVIKDQREIEGASFDLRVLLGVRPETTLELTTQLTYRTVEPDMSVLRREVMEKRPDLRAKHLLRAKRATELKLAKAIQYPDPTLGVGVMIQGPRGPDNQQQWAFGLSLPLPVFNRNQGGIMHASVAVQSAETQLRATLNEVLNELDLAHRKLVQSRRLVETYQAGVLNQALALLELSEDEYEAGTLGILELVDAARTASETKEDYLDALYRYQRDVLALEIAAGQPIK